MMAVVGFVLALVVVELVKGGFCNFSAQRDSVVSVASPVDTHVDTGLSVFVHCVVQSVKVSDGGASLRLFGRELCFEVFSVKQTCRLVCGGSKG